MFLHISHQTKERSYWLQRYKRIRKCPNFLWTICTSLHILFAFLPNISAVVNNISPLLVTCGLHTSYILFTTENSFIYRHFQKPLFYKNMPSVTYQLHTLCPEWHIPLVVPALVLRLLLLNLSCNQSILNDT